ncbi:hypothetical protein [Aquabacterium sp. NJ1]|uniref:hypothetical protein n=1 Tax=Aquabacterium sp. NJ1 TaxID=1538295 RepID=UPI00126A75A7|nr:hypothetical protein [Aquabacterium sp. NJ1]
MLHLFVCLNPISYHIAERVAVKERLQHVLVIYDPVRCHRSPTFKAWHLPLAKRSSQIAYALGAMRLVQRAFVPHTRLHSSRLTKAVARARSVAFIDDGLDTLRHNPRNLISDQIPARTRYYTFKEYSALPTWLDRLDTCQVGHLLALTQATSEVEPFPINAHVLIESPGLDIARTAEKLIQAGLQPIIISHPAPEKRGTRPRGDFIEQTCPHLDARIAISRGVHFYIGESMSLVIPLFMNTLHQNNWTVSLSNEQRNNLTFSSMLSTVLAAANIPH